jgi:chorismate mutase
MAVRAIRGAIQLDHDERDHLLSGVTDLVKAVMDANGLTTDDLISMLFTATPDLTSEFPALAARELGIVDVPLMCAAEIDVPGAMPRVVRLLVHIETLRTKQEIQHVYLGGAAALRRDIAQ